MASQILIIAEAGVNHNGDIKMAYKLIDAAVAAGVDIIKFQTFKAQNLVTKTAIMADYQIENTKKAESQYEMLKKLELSENDFFDLEKYCKTKKITFLSTGFDIESLKFLIPLNNGLWKIPSGEITNLPYLEFVGQQKQTVILSSGMSTLEEIKDAVHVLVQSGTDKKRITVLHCNTEYPTPFGDVHLNAMTSIKRELGVAIGYSDHTEGIEVSLAAAALGATVIEKHFTLDKSLPGPDHKASLDPNELVALVRGIRNIELALGDFEKKPSPSEQKNMAIARKSIVAAKEIKAGEIFSRENITTKRPGTGMSPMNFNELLGTPANRHYERDEFIQ